MIVVGRPDPQYGLPLAVILDTRVSAPYGP